MNSAIEKRLTAIQKVLMALYEAGNVKEVPDMVRGSEREYFISEYLSQLLPTWYRFGSGYITDGKENTSGQLDIVVELPFSLSFPMVGYQERLYLPEAVAVVIEVKSDLSTQWENIKQTASKLRNIKRGFSQGAFYNIEEDNGNDKLLPKIDANIPFYAIGYKGHKKIDTVIEKFDSISEEFGISGVLIIEDGYYVTKKLTATGTSALYTFVADLSVYLSSIMSIQTTSVYRHADISPR